MIDWSRIRELQDEIGTEDFMEVVELFLLEVAESLSGLGSSEHGAGDLEHRMHALKGCALNLGFVAMSELCQKGEQTAAAGHPESVNIDGVKQVFDASRDIFLNDLADRTAQS